MILDSARSCRRAAGGAAAILVTAVALAPADAPAAARFSFPRLRLDGPSGPRNSIYTAGNVIYPEGGVVAGSYYMFVVTDGDGTIRNPGFPCTPAASFGSTDNSYTVRSSDPPSTAASWIYTLEQFEDSSCTSTPHRTASRAFSVATAGIYADAGLTVPKTTFTLGETVFVSVTGLKPAVSHWSSTWILPSLTTACANTRGRDRPDSSASGTLADGDFLQYGPSAAAVGSPWNREPSYDTRPCPEFGSGNEGKWRLRVQKGAANFVVLEAFTVDATPPPDPTIESGPSNPTNSPTAMLAFGDAEPGARFHCDLDGGGFSLCASPLRYSGLADGPHTFRVKAADATGNESGTASFTWTIDTTPPPAPVITVAPPDPTNSSSARISFSSAEAGVTFTCALDGGSFAPCSSPQDSTNLGDGRHSFSVEATDAAGNTAPSASTAWIVDTAAPAVSLASPGDGASSGARPSFAGTAGTAPGDSSTVEVEVYSGMSAFGTLLQSLTAVADANGAYAVIAAALEPGTYTAQAVQSDAAGNAGRSAAHTFSVDPTILAAGDIAGCVGGADQTAALLDRYPDAVVIPLGDNAYVNGQPSEYKNCYDPTWGRAKARTRPVIGGHDEGVVPGGPPAGTGYVHYFADQLAPFGADAGDPTKLYYSYELGAWHVVVLNSSCVDAGFGGGTPGCDEQGQQSWLKSDLAAHPTLCTLAVWHDARFSSGNVHGNRLAMQAYWNILYANGVDLVLNAYEHDYERFAPQDSAANLDTQYGIREFVVGTGGYYLYDQGTIQPNSEVRNYDAYGVLKVDLHLSGYDWQFVPVAGSAFTDSGSTACHGRPPPPPPQAPSVRATSSNALDAARALPLAKPAQTTAGDLLVAIVAHQGGSTCLTPAPSGWTAVPHADVADGTNAGLQAWYRVAGAQEPPSYTFPIAGCGELEMTGGILDIANADASSPINVAAGQTNGSASRQVFAPSVETTAPYTLFVFAAATIVLTHWTQPGLMDEQLDLAAVGPYPLALEAATQALSSPGVTGQRWAYIETTGRSVVVSIAIQPAG